ncbi:MAG: hypothetical protein ABSD52_01445 [Candidatus Cybelea sp.]|jgi:hypothetical protein
MSHSIVAIDILMEPDATMTARAQAVNARLLGVFPQGYSLDASHRPHLTTVQQFVRADNLDEIYDTVGKVITKAGPADWQLKAYKYYYLPANGTGLAGIVVEPTDAWAKMQHDILDVVAPFTVKTATNDAFFTVPGEPEIVPGLIDYITAFVPEHSGKNFMPHVSVGVATKDYLDAMLAEPFDTFTFFLVGASVYQLGNYGTARKQLKTWDFRPK